MPFYFSQYRWKVFSNIPTFRQTTRTGTPFVAHRAKHP
jgi:hypothetical protein